MKYSFLVSTLVLMTFISCGGQNNSQKNDSGTLISEHSGSAPYIEVYDNGQPKIKGILEDGERDGLWVSFYENGVRWSEENYVAGKREGRTINFYPSGIMRYRGQFMDDKKAGLWQFYDEEGKLVKEETF